MQKQSNKKSAKAKPEQAKAMEKQPNFTKEVKVASKVVIGANTPITFITSKLNPLKGSFEVIISDGKSTFRNVVHHPIGITDLDDTDWVMTDASEIPNLIARSTNPDQGRLNQQRAAFKANALVTNRLLVRQDGALFYHEDLDNPRQEYMAAARKAQAAYETSHPDVKFGKEGWFKFMDLKIRKREIKIVNFLKDPQLKIAVESACPDTFRTRSGNNRNIDQERINPEGEVIPDDSAYDAFCYGVRNMKAMSLQEAMHRIEREENPETEEDHGEKPAPTKSMVGKAKLALEVPLDDEGEEFEDDPEGYEDEPEDRKPKSGDGTSTGGKEEEDPYIPPKPPTDMKTSAHGKTGRGGGIPPPAVDLSKVPASTKDKGDPPSGDMDVGSLFGGSADAE